MKVGDKVRIIKLVDADKECTDLKVGDIGIIVDINVDGIVRVKIDRHFRHNDNNYNKCDGSYDFLTAQLEVIKGANMIRVNTNDLIVTVRLRLDTNSDFFIDALIENGYWVRQEIINDTYIDVSFKESEDK